MLFLYIITTMMIIMTTKRMQPTVAPAITAALSPELPLMAFSSNGQPLGLRSLHFEPETSQSGHFSQFSVLYALHFAYHDFRSLGAWSELRHSKSDVTILM